MITIKEYISIMIAMMCILYWASSMVYDANQANGNAYAGAGNLPTFQKLDAYGSNFKNQSDNIKANLEASQGQPQTSNSPFNLVYLAMNSANVVGITFFGFFDIGIALINDMAIYIGIPVFYITMFFVAVLVGMGLGIANYIRGGQIL